MAFSEIVFMNIAMHGIERGVMLKGMKIPIPSV